MNAKQHDQSVDTVIRGLVSRRDALKVFCGLGLLTLATPVLAHADLEETEAELADARARYDAAQDRLEELAAEFEELSKEHADTLAKIDDVKARIDDVQAQIDAIQAEIDSIQAEIDRLQDEIDELQAEIERKQKILSSRVSSAYKSGASGMLEILLASASFEEFLSNVYYLDKISESDAKMIAEIRDAKAKIEAAQDEQEKKRAEQEEKRAAQEEKKAELVAHEIELEAFEATQQEELDAMSAKQAEVEALLVELEQEVNELIDKRDEELLAAARERALQQAAAAGYTIPAEALNGSGALAAVVASCYTVPTPGSGLCAMWVSRVFNNAGLGYWMGNANDMYNSWCFTSDRSALCPGMILAVSTHPSTVLGRIYGHVGIYIGGGTVMDNVGWIRTISLDQWISDYGITVPVRWGWLGGIALD